MASGSSSSSNYLGRPGKVGSDFDENVASAEERLDLIRKIYEDHDNDLYERETTGLPDNIQCSSNEFSYSGKNEGDYYYYEDGEEDDDLDDDRDSIYEDTIASPNDVLRGPFLITKAGKLRLLGFCRHISKII